MKILGTATLESVKVFHCPLKSRKARTIQLYKPLNLKVLKFSVFGVFRGTIKFNNTFTVSLVADGATKTNSKLVIKALPRLKSLFHLLGRIKQ